MEVHAPPYVTRSLIELPQSLLLDMAEELKPLRTLQVEIYPFFSDRDLEVTVKRLFSAIVEAHDVDYQLAAFSVDAASYYSAGSNVVSRDRVKQAISQTGHAMYRTLQNFEAYVRGFFPYKCVKVVMGCEVHLMNTPYLNSMLDIVEKPFFFNEV